MKSKRFSVEQIVSALKQHEAGLPIAEIARKLGIAEGTFYAWKKKYAGLESDQVRELKQLRPKRPRRNVSGAHRKSDYKPSSAPNEA